MIMIDDKPIHFKPCMWNEQFIIPKHTALKCQLVLYLKKKGSDRELILNINSTLNIIIGINIYYKCWQIKFNITSMLEQSTR